MVNKRNRRKNTTSQFKKQVINQEENNLKSFV